MHAARASGRIVLVEDDPAVLAAVAFALEVDGFMVDAFPDAEAALTADLSGAACLVLDYRLPGESGLDLLQRLREAGSTAPAVLITSHPRPAVRARATTLGARLVEKPLLTDELADEIRRLSGAA
jgi:two-component system C4-dicarboxylate transport response regulator DctD